MVPRWTDGLFFPETQREYQPTVCFEPRNKYIVLHDFPKAVRGKLPFLPMTNTYLKIILTVYWPFLVVESEKQVSNRNNNVGKMKV